MPFSTAQRKAADFVRISKVQLLVGGGGAAGVAPEHDWQLLPCNGIVGAETPIAIAVHDALSGGPADGPGVPHIARYIREVQQVIH